MLAVVQPLPTGGHTALRGQRVPVDGPDEPCGRAGRFFVLTQASDDLFVIRSWNRRDGINQQIRPGEPVSGTVHEVVTDGIPVPRDGALLGWVTDSQVTVLLAAHCRQPGTWDDTAPLPEIRVMPMAGTSELLHWPPFTVSPLDGGRVWDYLERGLIVDIAPLITDSAEYAYWVPSADRRSTRHEEGCVVITGNLPAEEYWLRQASTRITGRSARASSRRPRAACWHSQASWTWPTGSGKSARR